MVMVGRLVIDFSPMGMRRHMRRLMKVLVPMSLLERVATEWFLVPSVAPAAEGRLGLHVSFPPETRVPINRPLGIALTV